MKRYGTRNYCLRKNRGKIVIYSATLYEHEVDSVKKELAYAYR